MPTVQVLPPEIANVIAAGEVVERPASVVKELVENALDAGATDITIRLEQAGKRLIEVSDNGCGMSASDARLALERHATSKIQCADDLHRIMTLGFRGEAIPSIAAVSRFVLTSRVAGSDGPGVRITIPETAKAKPDIAEIGAPDGTTIRVEHLFAQLPGRRKFLKGDRTELSHIQEAVTRMALAAPHCRFRLLHGDRELIACHSTQGGVERIAELFGAEVSGKLIRLDETGAIRLHGYCGLPELARSGSSQSYTFVNGRAIRDRVVIHAISEGYRTYIPHGEQPFVVLFLEMAPEEVDVNVHPAKAEVRFANSGAVHHMISSAVRKCLSETQGLPAQRAVPSMATSTRHATHSQAPGHYMPARHAIRPGAGQKPRPLEVQEALALYKPHMDDAPAMAQERYRPLGQLAMTYLLYEGPDGELLVVDQHAAHERIGYEAFKASYENGTIERQTLLHPEIVELSPAACEALSDHQQLLEQLGFDVEPFGGNAVAVKAVPALLGKVDVAALLRTTADELQQYGATTAAQARIDHILMTMACHRQIRAGEVLRTPQIEGLLGEMGKGNSNDRCPHGRPTWTRFTRHEIEKWFKRS